MSNNKRDVQASEKSSAAASNEPSVIAQNKAALLHFQKEVINGHDWRVETLAKHMTPDFVDHTAGSRAEPGLEGASHRLEQWNAAFGGARKENIAVLGEGNMLAVLYDLHAWHTGEFMGVKPTNKKVVIPGIEILRFRDGKISDYWSIYDYLNTATEIRARLRFMPVAQDDAAKDHLDQEVYRGIAHKDRKEHTVFQQSDDASTGIVAQNKAVLHRFQTEVFNGHDWRVETLAKHLTPNFVDHAAGPLDQPGLEGVRDRFSMWQAAFDDAEEDNIAMVGEGDMLAVLYDLHARHTGEFMGIKPTNKEVVIPGIEMLRFRSGKIAEHWGIYDFVATAAAVGAELTFVSITESDKMAQPKGIRERFLPNLGGVSSADVSPQES